MKDGKNDGRADASLRDASGRQQEPLNSRHARLHHLPSFSGDGYGCGGGVVVTIGERAIALGEGAEKLGHEICTALNSHDELLKTLAHFASEMRRLPLVVSGRLDVRDLLAAADAAIARAALSRVEGQ